MIATDTLVKRGDDGSVIGGRGGGAWPLAGRPNSSMSRHDSEDVLGSLLVEGMPDRAAAANLENVPEGEVSLLAGVARGGGGGGWGGLQGRRCWSSATLVLHVPLSELTLGVSTLVLWCTHLPCCWYGKT